MLPIRLPQEEIDQLMKVADRGEPVEINLPEQKIRFGNTEISFEVDATSKHNLLNGLDDIGLTLEKAPQINDFENNQKETNNWLYKYGTHIPASGTASGTS